MSSIYAMNFDQNIDWHILSIEESLKLLNLSIEGLTSEEAEKRLLIIGANEIKRLRRRTTFEMLLDQFKDFMILVLISAAIISGLVGELTDTIAILVIVILNGVIGFIQEYRAEKAIEALTKMAEPSATVKRDGKIQTILSSKIVPGDIVMLEAGNIVSADMRLLENAQLKIEEAALTGESVPVEKDVKPIKDASLLIGDRKNMAYKGTVVTYGHGVGVVVATGMTTELGRIATMLEQEEEVKTPLQRNLARFGKRLAIIFLAICAIVFVAGVFRGEPVTLMLLTAISLAVAAIPEALPAVITIALALGAKKMVMENALIRKLAAVETLGSVTYICSDKTGTLTQNKMQVRELFVDGKILRITEVAQHVELNRDLFLALALSNDAQFDRNEKVIGDPTEVALCLAAQNFGFDKQKLYAAYPRIAEIPFDSERKCMTTFHRTPDNKIVSYTKGAIEVLEEKAKGIMIGGKLVLNKEDLRHINQRMASDGLRVLGIALRQWANMPEGLNPSNVETDLVILGLVGIIDPPRDEAKEAIKMCKTAGIVSVMITGDHPITARAIAHQLGMLDDDAQAIITGRELTALSLEEFEKRVEKIRVYARVAPEQKLKIVKALQDRGQIIAMTGDGVNDAPALKRADIGVAMGTTGTEVAKEASHMILLDDNFATIVKVVKEGRRIFDNIRKFIKYIMTSNSAEIWTIFLAPFLGLPIPLLPIQLLWINLVTDSYPALALATEASDKQIMSRPPRHPRESIFAHGLGVHVIWVGLLMAAVTLGTQAWSIKIGTHWQTMVFTVLALSQMGHVLAIRSEKESLFNQGLFSNLSLLSAVILTFGLQLATIYLPFLNPIFKTEPLSFFELVLCLVLSSVVFFAVEIEKFIKRLKTKKPRIIDS